MLAASSDGSTSHSGSKLRAGHIFASPRACPKGESSALSALTSSVVASPSLKEEVNRRLAEHKSRRESKNPLPAESAGSQRAAGSRAAEAAARVAARYANAPSFNDLPGAETQVSLRISAAATLEARPDAEEELMQGGESLEIDPASELSWQQCTISEGSSFPVIQSAPADYQPDPSCDWDWQEAGHSTPLIAGAPLITEAPQPNLIQFPRELVATRRIRPRIESQLDPASDQLSIFEVDPRSISTDPQGAAIAEPVGEQFAGPEWSGIELDSYSAFEEFSSDNELSIRQVIDIAPVSARFMSGLVDLSLITAVVCAIAVLVARVLHPLIAVKTAEIGGIALLLVATVFYEWLFLSRYGTTPGMRYAGIDLCTFDDQRPSRTQISARFIAMLYSLLPMGLGLAWALFDEDGLSWHDRRSRTYQRKY